MPSTRRPKAKAKKSRKKDVMSDMDNLDIMIAGENINLIETELANTIIGSANHYDTEFYSHLTGRFSQEIEFRYFGHENTIPRQERFPEAMETFLNEINWRLFQEMDSMMFMMHSQFNRVISSAIAERGQIWKLRE